MRRLVLFTVALWFASAPPGAAAQGVVKIGYIHSQAIIAQDAEAQAAQAQFDREMVPWQNELKRMEEEISTLMNSYQQQEVTLTPDARRQRQGVILQRQQQYQQRMVDIEQQAGRRQQELIQPVMERMNEVIQAILEEGNYTFIFDSSAGGLIAADEAFDLTEEVVRRLSAQSGNPQGG